MALKLTQDDFNYIEFNPLWNVRDSTKMNGYSECPRKFFFERVLGWQYDDSNIHLIHGEAHHRAQEIIIHSKYDIQAVDTAMEAYEEYYREFFSPHMDDVNYPKVPGVERDILAAYILTYFEDMHKYEVIYTETGGAVPITNEDVLWYRMDAVLKDKSTGLYLSHEHKTGSRNSEAWRTKWHTSFQIGTYTHALYSIFDPKLVWGVEINGIFYYKKKVSGANFERVSCEKTTNQIMLWLECAQRETENMDYDFELLAQCTPDDHIMKAFPMRGTACDNWSGCKYSTFCAAWPNPLKNDHHLIIPVEFKVDHWDPRQRALDTKTNFIEEIKEDENN